MSNQADSDLPDVPSLMKGKYRHFKGKEYEVLGISFHSETLEPLVVYRPLYKKTGPDFWVRPYEMFSGNVEVDGESKARFEYVEN